LAEELSLETMSKIDEMLNAAFQTLQIEVGDVFEDCSYHPVLCLGVDYKDDNIWGVSLIDGSFPRNCSLIHCGVRKLSLKEAWHIKLHGPSDEEAADRFEEDRRWWRNPTGPVPLTLEPTVLPRKLPRMRTKKGKPDVPPNA
jgi:hypothetical protein